MAADSGKLKIVVLILALATALTLGLVVRRMWIVAGEPEKGPVATGDPSKAPKEGDKLDAVITAAAEYGQRQEWEKAEVILKEAANQYPDVQRVRLAYAECLIKQKKLAEAFAEFDRALALGEVDVTTRITIGTLANMLGKAERAEEQYAAVMVKDKTNPDAPLFLGQILMKQGRLDEAKGNLLIAGRITPQRSVVWGTLAEISLRENKLEIAAQHLKKARELEPEIVEWKLIEARLLNRQQKPEKALEVLLGLDKARMISPAVARLMAESYGMLGKRVESAAALVAASDAAPSDGELALEAALATERAGDKAAAKALAERAEKAGNSGAKAILERLK